MACVKPDDSGSPGLPARRRQVRFDGHVAVSTPVDPVRSLEPPTGDSWPTPPVWSVSRIAERALRHGSTNLRVSVALGAGFVALGAVMVATLGVYGLVVVIGLAAIFQRLSTPPKWIAAPTPNALGKKARNVRPVVTAAFAALIRPRAKRRSRTMVVVPGPVQSSPYRTLSRSAG